MTRSCAERRLAAPICRQQALSILATLTRAWLLVLVLPAVVLAQTAPDAPTSSKIQWGRVGLTPHVAVKNIGFDTNPLNQAAGAKPDLTAMVVPSVDSVIPIGPGRLTGRTTVEWSFFSRIRAERSINVSHEGRAELPSSRFAPYLTVGDRRTAQRPNLEVDLRVQQHTTMVAAGATVPVNTRLRLEFEAGRTGFGFGRDTHDERSLATVLERRVEHAGVTARVALSPLATVVLRSDIQRDRFKFSLVRNSNSVSVVPGVELKSRRGSGSIAAGYRHFNVLGSGVPDFAGVVAHVDVNYAIRHATRVSVRADHDVEYSVELAQPYFLVQGAALSVTRMLGAHWDVAARLGRSVLAYRDFVERMELPARRPHRADRVDAYGLGLGLQLRRDLRCGADLDHVSRQSVLAAHGYTSVKFGVSMSYGF